jgi:hypothetical protein
MEMAQVLQGMSEEQFEAHLAHLEEALAFPMPVRQTLAQSVVIEPELPAVPEEQPRPIEAPAAPVRVPTFRSLLASEVAEAHAQKLGGRLRDAGGSQVVEFNIGDPFGRTLQLVMDARTP